LSDIIYYGESKVDPKNCFYIKRGDEVSDRCSKRIIQDMSYCKKIIPWAYEHECRLIVSIEKNGQMDGCDVIKIPVEQEKINSLRDRILFSPTYQGDAKYKKSPLSGKISWEEDN